MENRGDHRFKSRSYNFSLSIYYFQCSACTLVAHVENRGDHLFNYFYLATYHFLYEFIICNAVPYYFVIILCTGVKQSHPYLWINFIISYTLLLLFFFCVLTTKEQLFNNNCSLVFFFFCRFLWNRLNMSKVSILPILNLALHLF